MAELEDNVVPLVVLGDNDESKLADSQGITLGVKKGDGGGTFVVPTIGKTAEAENITPNSVETVLAGGIGVKGIDHACLNGRVVRKQTIRDNVNTCLIDGKSEEHGFIAGDLVWCKIKNDPWLPAQVYDLKDASEIALKYRQEDRLLVAFFGDDSCAWCLPSQLMPFVDNFVKMSGVCNSKRFLNAVQKAVEEFRRIVASDVVCKCVPESQIGVLARPIAENSRVRTGVLVPEVDVNRLSVSKYEPLNVLPTVCHFAKTVSVANNLHLEALKCRLSAFYRYKGGYQLPLYCEPVYIEGLGEEKQNLSPVVNDFDLFSSDNVHNCRRKTKTLAELLGGNAKVEPKREGSLSVGKKTRKRKVESLESNELKKENVCEESVDTCLISKKPDEIEVTVDEDISVTSKQELDNVFTPRERKKSKYLCPPYTSLIGMRRSISRKSISKSEEYLPDEKLNKITPFPLSDVEMPVNELLAKIQLAAVKPLHMSNNVTTDKVSSFVSAVSNYNIYREGITGQKKEKSSPSQPKFSMATKMETISDTDDFISNVIFVRRQLEIMTINLEKYHASFSLEEKVSLKENIKQIMESVDNVSEKVETASEKVRIAEKNSG